MCLAQFDCSRTCLAGFVLVTLTQAAIGQMVWKQANPRSSPTGRIWHAMAYDSTRGQTVLFGGRLAQATPSCGNAGSSSWCSTSTSGLGPAHQDTWEYDGNTWVKRSPTNSPSPRINHVMAYDTARRVVVLFGGWDRNKVLNDTWEFDGTNWRRRQPSTSPVPLGWQYMVYDRARRVTVVFVAATTSSPSETWEWNGTNWRRCYLVTSPQAASTYHSMTYDVARGVVVLLGRSHWEWSGSKIGWRNRGGSPGAGTLFRIVYDEGRQRTVCLGNRRVPAGTGPLVSDLWEWDGRAWRQGSARLTPARAWPVMVYDSKRQRVVLFAGVSGNGFHEDTWEYYPTHRGTASPIGTGCAGSAGIPALTASGPPILGNQDFLIRLSNARPNSSVFVGFAPKPTALSLGGCTLYLNVSSSPPILITGRSNSTGGLDLRMPIPFNSALSGFRIDTQGFVRDPRGTFFGGLAFTQALRLRIGD